VKCLILQTNLLLLIMHSSIDMKPLPP
jgi:hypothetical protein